MIPMIMVIICSIIAGGTCKSHDHQRRFFLDDDNNQFNPYSYLQPSTGGIFCSFCSLRCSNGYVRSQTGCLLCQCQSIQSQSVSLSTSGAAASSGYYIPNPCQPHIRYCTLRCASGLKRGQNGCQYCACANTTTTITSRPATFLITTVPPRLTSTRRLPSVLATTLSHPAHGVFLSNPCQPHIRFCTKKCPNGFRTGRNGCQYCQCSRYNSAKTTLTVPVPTTVRTTSTTAPIQQKNKNYFDPCIPSQTTCNKDCGGDYIKGPQGCQYCICASNLPPELRHPSTEAPVTPYGIIPVNQTTTVAPHVMSEACTVAKAVCQYKCPTGFLSKADDCLYCKCHANTRALDVDDAADENGFMVNLPNPCVQGSNRCELLCTSGYLLGPRDCVFCTCRS